MKSKLSISKLFLSVSYFSALLSLTVFSFLKIPFFFNEYFSFDSEKSFILVVLTTLSALSYLFYLIFKKDNLIPENKTTSILYLAFPVTVILSTIYSFFASYNINVIFGKDVATQTLISYLFLIFSIYIISTYFKKYKSSTYILIFLSSLLITIPTLVGLVTYKLGFTSFSNYLVSFVDNWDIVAVSAGIISVLALAYYEIIAYTKKQKVTSLILLVVHLVLISAIIIPDIWYSIALSSIFILLISIFYKKEKKIYFFKRLSFIIFVISLIFSVFFSLQNPKIQKLSSFVANFYSKYTGINYNFIKPKFALSMDIGISELKKGKIFGAGPSEFSDVWTKEKPSTIISSDYWNINFISSFSAFTTLFVTIGIVGVLVILFLIVITFISIAKIIRKNNEDSYKNLDIENKFYFIVSTSLFIFSTSLFFLFANTSISILLLTLAFAIILGQITNYKTLKVSKNIFVIVLLILILGIISLTHYTNKLKTIIITNNALASFKTDNNIDSLEQNLIKAANISNTDDSYRLLNQFYLYKVQQLINTPTEDKANLEKNVIASINNAILASKTAINLDKQNSNNYLSLGSIYSFLIGIDNQNKSTYFENAKAAYEQASALNPKDPTIPLTLAELNYSYNQDASSTIKNISNSLSIKQNYSPAYYALSQLAAKNNDRDSALKYAALAIQADQKNTNAYIQYGILVINKNNLSQDELSQAYTAFISALNLEPNNTTAGYYLATTYILAKEYDNAQKVIDALKKALPNEQKITDLQNFLNSKKGTSTPQIPQSKNIKPATSTKKK